MYICYRWHADGTKSGYSSLGGQVSLEYLGSLRYIRNEEGVYTLADASAGSVRIMVSEGSNGNIYTPHYYFTDHLGSTRAIIADGQVLEIVNYYPYGVRWNWGFNNGNMYFFNGKEELFEGMLDYGARMYTSNISRWTSVDPLAEIRPWESPYVFCGNNPVNRIDPNGMIWDDVKAAEMLKKNIDGQIASLNNNTAKKQAELDGGGLSEKKITNLENTILENKERVSNLMQSIADIDKLGADQENTYAFSPISGGKHQVRKGDDGKIYIETSSNALSVHEITHVRQSLDAGGLKFSPNGALLNASGNTTPGSEHWYQTTSGNEVEAYRMQYSLDRSFPGNLGGMGLKGIDVHSVGNIREDGQLLYAPINTYSTFILQRAIILMP